MFKFYSPSDPAYLLKLSTIKKLQRNCLEHNLFCPPLVQLQCSILNTNNLVIDEKHTFSHSYVRNFYNWSISQLMGVLPYSDTNYYGDGSITIKDINGDIVSSESSLIFSYYDHFFYPTEPNYPWGIWVGSSDEPTSFDAYDLNQPIIDGAGQGQLSYILQSKPIFNWDPNDHTATVTHSRSFENKSQSSVIIKESGHRVLLYSPSYNIFLFNHDVLPSPIVLNVNQILSIKYIYSMQFPT